MPITSSAKKALRSSLNKRVYNTLRKDALKDKVKEFRKLASAGLRAEAEKLLSGTYQAIDKAAKTGVIKKNTASRKKSRLARLLNKKTS